MTGMEIDLLATHKDEPRTILVECKAHRDPLSADSISKLLGNVTLRSADAGWLFSTSDLSKDGRGLWFDIQNNPDHARRFIWYSPSRTIEVLLSQRAVQDPTACQHYLHGWNVGDWTLVITPRFRAWLAQIVEEGIPTRFAVFDAKSGSPIDPSLAQQIANTSPRFSSLTLCAIEPPQNKTSTPQVARAVVARVSPGDSWDDPRPARPKDFVGRDDLIRSIASFIGDVRNGETQTRTFAIQAPSGWGKSSLTLKLSALARRGRIPHCSLTAVDTRSATNSAFVSEALRQAFDDAATNGVIPEGEHRIDSLRDPLDSVSLMAAVHRTCEAKACIVLLFDQFEELFAKEALFETFNAVRELSLDLDAKQLPLVLGFAWKTDISLPQQHPAYHLWHQLADRRKSFRVREFGLSDIRRVIGRAERAQGTRLASPLKARLIEQCQGFPWLLKKLLVHILQRLSEEESQYFLLERELDVEHLFKEDLASLNETAIRCLRYVAMRAPVAVAEVEDSFPRDTTNLLINAHLLVRSGMNYVIYWDIFRDYLVDGKVPKIPWARTFQRGPTTALRVLATMENIGGTSIPELARYMGLKEGTCFNVVADLVALQVVELGENGSYRLASHIENCRHPTVARHVQGQLRRHIIVRELSERWEIGRQYSLEEWHRVFANAQPGAAGFTTATVHAYANNLKAWLLFAGLLDQRGRWIFRPAATGSFAGVLRVGGKLQGLFLGTASPTGLLDVMNRIADRDSISRSEIEGFGLRNALSDALALELVQVVDKNVSLLDIVKDEAERIAKVKASVLKQPSIQVLSAAWNIGIRETEALGRAIEERIGASWQRSSAMRYASGLRRYWKWAKGTADENRPRCLD